MVACTRRGGIITLLIAGALLGWVGGPAQAAVQIDGQVQMGGGPVAQSTVTLWAGERAAPEQS